MIDFWIFPLSTIWGAYQCTDLEKGQIRQSEFPSYVIQAHIPYIAPGDLVNVYPLFEIRLPQSHWL